MYILLYILFLVICSMIYTVIASERKHRLMKKMKRRMNKSPSKLSKLHQNEQSNTNTTSAELNENYPTYFKGNISFDEPFTKEFLDTQNQIPKEKSQTKNNDMYWYEKGYPYKMSPINILPFM